MSVTTAQAISLLENVLFESKTLATANAAGWVSLSNLNSSYSTVAGLATAMSQTAEATIAQQVIRYYEGALGRAPSGAEVTYYVNIVENGNTAAGIPAMTASEILTGASAVPAGTWDKIASFFAASPEFAFASAGGNVVNLLYLNILGRAPNAAEIAYYQNLLTGGTTVSTLVQYFTTSPEYQDKVNASIETSTATYGTTVANGGSATGAVVPVLGGTSSTTTVALTTGVDTITGVNNVTINGTDTTVTALDSIALTGGGNVLNINDVTGTTVNLGNLQSVSGVQTLNLTSSLGLLASKADVSAWTGLTAANFKLLAMPVGGAAITAAATTAVTVAATTGVAAAPITVNGGSTVAISDAHGTFTAGAITVNGGTGTTGASVTLTGTGAVTGVVSVLDQVYVAGSTATTSTLTSVTLDGTGAGALVKSDALTNLTLNDLVATATVAITDASLKQTLNLAVSNDKAGAALTTGAGFTTIDVTTGAKDSALKIIATADKALNVAGSSVLTVSSASQFATGTAVAVSGAAGLTINTTTLGAGTITSIASTSTGVISATINGGTTTFTGGAGQDIVTISTAASVAVTGGSATNNEIIWNGAVAPTSLGTVSGFTTFGIGSAYADTTSASIDMSTSTLAGFNAIDVVGNTATAALTIDFVNVTAGTALSISGSVTNTTTADSIVYKIAGATGATSSVALSLGTAKTTGITVDSLTLVDSSAHGLGTVSITSKGSATSDVNTITTLVDNALSVLNVAGSADFTVTNAIATTATSLTINATETGDNGLTLGGVTSTGGVLTSLTFTGSADVTVTALTDALATGTLTITDSSSGDVTITTATIASAPALTITNSGSGDLVFTNVVTDNLAATLTLNGDVKIAFTDGLTTGITVAGSTDADNVTLSIFGAATTKTDTITLGDGDNSVTVTGASAGTEKITLGNGDDTVTLTAHTGKATVSVGTGVDTVAVGTGQTTVAYGTHSSTLSVFDTANLSALVTASFGTATTNSQTSINAASLDVITGLHLGDKLVLGANTNAITTSSSNGLAGAASSASFAHGDYNATSGLFTLDAAGTDTLVTFSSGAASTWESVVLVGVDFTSAMTTAASLSGHTVTLA